MGEEVEFRSNGDKATGYFASPAQPGPGVVVIQEWWGLVPHIRDVCDRFAAAGFAALAPDLYHGKVTREPDEARKLVMEMQLDQASREIIGAAQWLLDGGRTTGDRVGVVGFCMGAALALYAASLSDRFGAVSAFYPTFARTEYAKPDHSKIRGAVLGHFAEHDHAFFNDSRPEAHRPEAAQLAWQRTIDFFNTHLRAASGASRYLSR